MALGKLTRTGLVGVFLRWATGLRFPWLFLLTAALFVVDLLVPDTLPFADELLMGLVALLLGSLKKKKATPPATAQGLEFAGDATGRDADCSPPQH